MNIIKFKDFYSELKGKSKKIPSKRPRDLHTHKTFKYALKKYDNDEKVSDRTDLKIPSAFYFRIIKLRVP